tara:strand:- start:2488 stop:2895 length:408 start_codon:yes stop_codon:yes gene_type:complete
MEVLFFMPNLKSDIELILKENPETRNSDITLTIEIWKRFYGSFIFTGTSGNKGIWLETLYSLPREDNIKRIRANFCNQGKEWAYPTDIKVALARGIKEQEWRQKLGYPRFDDIKYPTKKESYTEKVKVNNPNLNL